MAKHPVPKDYGHPCNEGELIPQGTGSSPPIYKYEETDEPDQDKLRGALSLDKGNLFDDYC